MHLLTGGIMFLVVCLSLLLSCFSRYLYLYQFWYVQQHESEVHPCKLAAINKSREKKLHKVSFILDSLFIMFGFNLHECTKAFLYCMCTCICSKWHTMYLVPKVTFVFLLLVLICIDNSLLTQSRFILLDTILLCFILLAFLALLRFRQVQDK